MAALTPQAPAQAHPTGPGVLQQALGPAWYALAPALQRHHAGGVQVELGHLDIECAALMRPLLMLLGRLGALVSRPGRAVATRVEKRSAGTTQHWERTMRHADGRVQRFDSVWCLGADGLLTEYVNPWLGLRLRPRGVGATLQIDGVCFVVRCGRRHLTIPEWLALGHTTITEHALDDHRIAMDFSLTHPLCGRWFRYSGVFSVSAEPESPGRP